MQDKLYFSMIECVAPQETAAVPAARFATPDPCPAKDDGTTLIAPFAHGAGGATLCTEAVFDPLYQSPRVTGRPLLKKWIAGPFDPRIHFALNCGAQSCAGTTRNWAIWKR